MAMQQFLDEAAKEAAASLSVEEAKHLLFNGHLPLSWMGLARYHRKRAQKSIPSLL